MILTFSVWRLNYYKEFRKSVSPLIFSHRKNRIFQHFVLMSNPKIVYVSTPARKSFVSANKQKLVVDRCVWQCLVIKSTGFTSEIYLSCNIDYRQKLFYSFSIFVPRKRVTHHGCRRQSSYKKSLGGGEINFNSICKILCLNVFF